MLTPEERTRKRDGLLAQRAQRGASESNIMPLPPAPAIVIEAPLSYIEKQELARYEAIVIKHKHTFLAVARALYEIWNKRLYREVGKSFRTYCRVRFGLEHSQIYRDLEAVSVLRDLNLADDPETMEAAQRLGITVSCLRELRDVPASVAAAIVTKLFANKARLENPGAPAPKASDVRREVDAFWEKLEAEPDPVVSEADVATLTGALDSLPPDAIRSARAEQKMVEARAREQELIGETEEQLPGPKADAKIDNDCVTKALKLLLRSSRLIGRLDERGRPTQRRAWARQTARRIRDLLEAIEDEWTAPELPPAAEATEE